MHEETCSCPTTSELLQRAIEGVEIPECRIHRPDPDRPADGRALNSDALLAGLGIKTTPTEGA